MSIQVTARAEPSPITKNPISSSSTSGQPNPSEATASEAVETPKEEGEKLSPQFAALARKEKQLRAKYHELKSKEEALKTKESKYETSYINKAQLQERLSQDPMSVLSELGLTYDRLTELALNQPGPQDQAIMKLEAKIKELEAKQSDVVSQQAEREKTQYEQAVNQLRNEAKILVDGNQEFEMIKDTKSEEAIVELIRNTFDQEGILLSVEEAAKEVEEYLIEEAIKMAQLKKVQAKLSPIAREESELNQQTQKISAQTPPSTMKTLTNAVSASSSTTSLSEKARRERAILAFKGQLK